MKKIYLILFGLLLIPPYSIAQLYSNGWVYVDGDEFNNGILDFEKKWLIPDERASIKSKTLHFYTASGNFSYGQDPYAHFLRIITKKETVQGRVISYLDDNEINPNDGLPNLRTFNFTSGCIVTKQPYKWGNFEIRFKAPAVKGLWPAFWLYGYDEEEFDIMELKGEKMHKLHWAMHGPQTRKCGFLKNEKCSDWITYQNINFANPDYNVVSGMWVPGLVMWVVNGIGQKFVLHDFNGPMRVIVNTSVASDYSPTTFRPGPDLSSIFPANFDIDYIRIWTGMECSQDIQICNQLQNIYDETVTTGRVITMGDGICGTYIMPKIGALVSPLPPYFSDFDVTHRDLIAAERIVLNPSSNILFGSDFTARISPCNELMVTHIDTTGLFPNEPIEEEEEESLNGYIPQNNGNILRLSPLFNTANNKNEVCEIMLTDMQNNVLLKKTMEPNENCEFNLSYLKEGYYILKTVCNSSSTIQKIYLIK